MKQLFKGLAKLITGGESSKTRAKANNLTVRDLIRLESKIGAQLFGPVPKGHRREFFCLDEHTWVWHEESRDAKGKMISTTIRYEIHPNNILKVQEGHPYQIVEGEELHNFALATRMYREQVIPHVYGRDPITGEHMRTAQPKKSK